MDRPGPLRVLIADDHGAVRLGLAAIVSTIPGARVVGEAGDGQAAVDRYVALRPDVLILDLSMPVMGGVEVIRRICQADPDARILVVTMFDRENDVASSLRSGARGYVLKTAPAEEIEQAVLAVARGQRFVPPKVAAHLVAHLSASALTPRELEVLAALRHGASNKSIARRLDLAECTVKAYVFSIMGKLEAVSRTGAVRVALDRGLLPQDGR